MPYTGAMAVHTVRQPVAHMSEAEFLTRIHEKPSLEFIDGVIYRKPVAGRRHSKLTQRLDHEIYIYAQQHGGWGGPEVHVNFSEEFHRVYRVPDISYWTPDKPDNDSDIPLPPTLAIEVRSPDQSMNELREKCTFMLDGGVDVCWLVDPQSRSVEIFEGEAARTLGDDSVLQSAALPGFSLPIAELFAVID